MKQTSHQQTTPDVTLQPWIRLSLISSGILVGIGFLAAWLGFKFPRPEQESFLVDLGNYGSYLQGTVASLWALAGAFLLLAAFLAQKQQLFVQRQELELTRSELEEQKQQFEVQFKGIKLQNFENRFFQMLSLHHRLVADMVDENATGRDCFKKWYDELGQERARWKETILYQEAIANNKFDERRFSVDRYDELYRHRQGDLGHYFRNLYHIIKFVDASEDIPAERKRDYTTLVRAQLSSYEQALLFYNGIHPVSEHFDKLIARYGLLHNLDQRLLFAQSHKNYFPPETYMGSGASADDAPPKEDPRSTAS